MRDVLDAIDRLGIGWFVTGSVAASVHGVLRSSQDIDVVLDMDVADFSALGDALGPSHAIADPIDFGDFAMASVIDRATAQKVDLILRRSGPFEASAMARRERADIPGLGQVWVASVEDLILAKLVWSGGTSELQLRDCEQLWRLNARRIDQAYLDLWAARLGLVGRLGQISMRPDPGRALQEAAILGMDAEARGRERLRLSERGRLLAWAQADAAGPMSELEQAEFLLRRLYPDMPEVSLGQILEELADAHAAGTWMGFERPAPLETRD